MILHFLGHIKDGDLLTDDNFDDDPDGLDDNLELSSMTKYSASCDFVKAVRGMHYNSQARLFRAFHKFIMKGDIWGNVFLERFEESCNNIYFDGDKVDFYTLEWVYYILNDFDNAISDFDYKDPMFFFDAARRLEVVIVKEEGRK